MNIVQIDGKIHYSASSIKRILYSLNNSDSTLIIKNAHYLTAKAFYFLQSFIENESKQLNVLLESDKTDKVYPPLLGYVNNESIN